MKYKQGRKGREIKTHSRQNKARQRLVAENGELQGLGATLVVRDPKHMSPSDTRDNFAWFGNGEHSAAAVIKQVALGKKPLGTIPLKRTSKRLTALLCRRVGLTCTIKKIDGVDHVLFHQPIATLRDYYRSPDMYLDAYKSRDVEIPEGIFDMSIPEAAGFMEGSLAVTGLCLGYPLDSTLCLLRDKRFTQGFTIIPAEQPVRQGS